MDTMNLHDLFSMFFFTIPDYQRGFAWKEKQLDELWDDIKELGKKANEETYRTHYTGTLFLEAEKNTEMIPKRIMHVVDGQQRLTAITILLFVLIKTAEKKSENGILGKSSDTWRRLLICESEDDSNSYKLSYGKENINHLFLKNCIFEGNTSIDYLEDSNIYRENLKKAKSFFYDKVKDLGKKDRDILFCKVVFYLTFDVRELDENLSAQTVFETLNNRGKPLTILERLKNRLFYCLEMSQDEKKKNTKKTINNCFKTIYERLGRYNVEDVDEDNMLSDFLSIYRKPLSYTFTNEGAERKVFQMFCNNPTKYSCDEREDYSNLNGCEREGIADPQKITDFVERLKDFCLSWVEFYNPDCVETLRLRALGSEKAIRILFTVILWKKSNKDRLLSLMEKIMFRNSVPGAYFFNQLYFATLARWYYKGVSDDKDNKPFDSDNLVQFLENEINKEINKENIVSQFKYLFTYNRGNKGFHRWWGLKYFLFEYQDYLKQQRNDMSVIGWDQFYNASIEHVMPQTSETNWSQQLQQITEMKNPEDTSNVDSVVVAINSLGNLTLLLNSKNSELSNKSWVEKKEEYTKDNVMNKQISETTEWNLFSIKNRGMDMISFLEKKLLEPGDQFKDKKELLFYSSNLFLWND